MIDDHCHPFALEPAPLDLPSLSLDLGADPDGPERLGRLAAGRIFPELLSVRLAAYLGCEPDELPQARAEAAADWSGYVSALFDDAGLTGLVFDPSYPPGAEDRLDEFGEVAARPVWWLHRIDPLIDRLIGEGAGATDVLEETLAAMSDAAGRGCVGFKTVVAYRTGLGIDPAATLEDAERSLQDDATPVRRRAKACRDLVLRRALGLAADLGRPFQFHTGVGDSELRLAESNPLLLEELLRTPQGQAAKVVLIHGSYPWHEEAAYLAATKPNVWTELSLFNIFSPVTVGDRLLRILDLAPSGRILAGTDGHGQPETHWFAASVLRDGWRQVRTALAGAGARERWLDGAEAAVFEGNAREVYGL